MAPKVPFSCRALLVSGIYYSDIGFLRVLAVRRLGFHAPHTPSNELLIPPISYFHLQSYLSSSGFSAPTGLFPTIFLVSPKLGRFASQQALCGLFSKRAKNLSAGIGYPKVQIPPSLLGLYYYSSLTFNNHTPASTTFFTAEGDFGFAFGVFVRFFIIFRFLFYLDACI